MPLPDGAEYQGGGTQPRGHPILLDLVTVRWDMVLCMISRGVECPCPVKGLPIKISKSFS